MSKRTAQFVLVLIILLQVGIYQFSVMNPESQLALSGLIVMIQGWMTNDAYHRNVDGTKATGTGDGSN